jgi:hypothetical protein
VSRLHPLELERPLRELAEKCLSKHQSCY